MDVWTDDDVWLRWIEAVETERRLPPVRRPRAYGNGMPAYVHDADDKKDQEPESKREVATAGMVRRYEQVLDWTIDLFPPGDRGAETLWLMARCTVYDRSIAKLAKKLRVDRATLYRRLNRAKRELSIRLNNASCVVARADLAVVQQFCDKNTHKSLGSESRDRLDIYQRAR
ncbi:MAG: DUF6362 family protein [Beijerinckiaceae bacterium]